MVKRINEWKTINNSTIPDDVYISMSELNDITHMGLDDKYAENIYEAGQSIHSCDSIIRNLCYTIMNGYKDDALAGVGVNKVIDKLEDAIEYYNSLCVELKRIKTTLNKINGNNWDTIYKVLDIQLDEITYLKNRLNEINKSISG